MAPNEKYREVVFYKRYFDDFFDKQSRKVQTKIYWTINLVESLRHVPEIYLKRLEGTDGLFEIRVQQASNIFRIFCFFDEGKLIVLINGFQKKTQKTPKDEIERALRIKEEYYAEKN
jgi:phage-related protein